MIEHFETCKEIVIKHDCPKCDITNLTKDQLFVHLKKDCPNMEVVCYQCYSEPVLRKVFLKDDHTQNICLSMLSLKVKMR